MIVQESLVLGAFCTIFDVEGQREEVKNIFLSQFIVLFEVVEHCFFVSKEKIILNVVVDQKSTVVHDFQEWLA